MRFTTSTLVATCLAVGTTIEATAGEGDSAAYQTRLPDGAHVLVRKGDDYGGFVLLDQKMQPEACDYRWWYRTDGGTKFDSTVNYGTSNTGNAIQIEFGPFKLSWSMGGKGSGWLYYSKMPFTDVEDADIRLCITDRISLAHCVLLICSRAVQKAQ